MHWRAKLVRGVGHITAHLAGEGDQFLAFRDCGLAQVEGLGDLKRQCLIAHFDIAAPGNGRQIVGRAWDDCPVFGGVTQPQHQPFREQVEYLLREDGRRIGGDHKMNAVGPGTARQIGKLVEDILDLVVTGVKGLAELDKVIDQYDQRRLRVVGMLPVVLVE